VQSAPSPYQLKLLTGFWFGLSEPDMGGEIDIVGQKSRALFCILALEGSKPLTRTYLSALLWEDMHAEQAAVNFRQTLSVIKRALGDHYANVLAVTKQTIAFRLGALTIDADAPDLIDDTPPHALKLLKAQSCAPSVL
jgi:two-component SAPR family response regulator